MNRHRADGEAMHCDMGMGGQIRTMAPTQNRQPAGFPTQLAVGEGNPSIDVPGLACCGAFI